LSIWRQRIESASPCSCPLRQSSTCRPPAGPREGRRAPAAARLRRLSSNPVDPPDNTPSCLSEKAIEGCAPSHRYTTCMRTAYVGMRRHMSAYVSVRQQRRSRGVCPATGTPPVCGQHTSAYVGIRRHTSLYVCIRRHTSAHADPDSIRQHTFAYVSIRRNTSAYVSRRRHT
jgi:hypothetical protein